MSRSILVPVVAIAVVAAACSSGSPRAAPSRAPAPASAAIAGSPSPPSPSTYLRLVARVSRPREGAFVSPVQPGNKPNAVPGDTNGRMPARDLVGVAPNCLAERGAGPSLGLLLATARDAGVPLSTDECYRPLQDQVTVKATWTAAGNSACAAPVVTTSTGKPKGTSMHGWGKAADFGVPGSSLTFGSATYAFLTAQAGRFGWNHPGWAQPGGSSCPEPWHWEWVGDGGILGDSRIVADVVTLLPSRDGSGYTVVTGLGAMRRHGDAFDAGSSANGTFAWLVVAAAATPDGGGSWLVCADGSVHAIGDAPDLGSLPAGPLAQPVVGIAPAVGGAGYWLATSDGQVFGFGGAGSYGSPSASFRKLARPIVAIVATPDGKGYWLAGADGSVYPYGDARSFGSAAKAALRAPVISMAATSDGKGYWLAGADGAVYAYGDARSFGSAAKVTLREPIVAIAATPSAQGYWLVAADGSVFAFGDAGIYRAPPPPRGALRPARVE